MVGMQYKELLVSMIIEGCSRPEKLSGIFRAAALRASAQKQAA